MSQAGLIALDFAKHELQCPHCKQEAVHHSPGTMILFATVTCAHCGRSFLVAMDKPHVAGCSTSQSSAPQIPF
jgi:transposase-like protein